MMSQEHILIVDDEELICEGMCQALSTLGFFTVSVARSGVEALAVIRARRVDAMLLDIAMPDMDGLALMKTLAAEGVRPLTVIVSGYEEFDYARQALTFGAMDYVLKPIDSEDVIEIGQRIHRRLAQSAHIQAAKDPTAILDATASAGKEVPRPGTETGTIRDETEGRAGVRRRVAHMARDIVERDYADGNLSVNRISERLNYTSNYVGDMFKRTYGISINEYLNQYRVLQARTLMDETDLMIYEIAYRVGFKDQHYFSRMFRRYQGLTPTAYRERKP